ncbi:MAG: hypothetical protein AAGI51_18100 [Pseudomonadota bacterium]
MPLLSALHPRPEAVLRDAEVDATHYVGRGARRMLACAAAARYLDAAADHPPTAAVVVPPDLVSRVPERLGVVVDDDPEIAFYRLHNRLAETGWQVEVTPGVHPTASIHPTAWVEDGCRIGPGVVIEAGALIHARTVIGENALICSGAILGGEGQVNRRRGDLRLRAAHVGGVRIGPGSEILSGVIIQRATFEEFTEVGARCVLTSGVKLAHGVRVGDDVSMGMGAQVSGYSTIGDGAWLGPGAVVSSLVDVGAGARVEIGAVLVRSIPPDSRHSGLFARSHARMRAMSEALARLGR